MTFCTKTWWRKNIVVNSKKSVVDKPIDQKLYASPQADTILTQGILKRNLVFQFAEV